MDLMLYFMGKNGAEVLQVSFANMTYQRKSKVSGNFGYSNALEVKCKSDIESYANYLRNNGFSSVA